MTLINDLVTFLANPPGNFVYILALAFTLIGSFQGALSQWRMTGYPQSRRLVLGLGLLLAFQLVLFLISGLLEQEIVVGRELLPIFDRAVVLLSLIWLIWLWAFPEPTRSGDAASMLMSLLVLAAAALGSVMYLSGSPVIGTFNASEQAFYWDLGGIVIAVMGLIVLVVRKPAQWGTGFAVAALALVGFGVDILFPTSEGDFSGIVRFCMLAAFPLLFSLSTRFPTSYSHQPVPVVSVEQSSVSNETQPQQDANGQEEQDTRERRRYSTDPKTLQSLLALAAEPDGTKINQHIARSIAQSLLVDLCFLIYLGDDKNSLYIATGYDLIREENLDGGIINRDAVPMLANAVIRGRPLRLPASTTSSDLKGLGELLGLPSPGNLLNVPILTDKGPIGSILLLSPYSNRIWIAEDQTILTSIASSFVPILERSQHTREIDQDRERALSNAQDAVEQALRLRSANTELTEEINELKKQMEQVAAEAARQKEQLDQAAQVEPAPRGWDGQIVDASLASSQLTSNLQLENELRMTLVEMARLQNQLAESNTKLLQLESRTSLPPSANQSEVIASISQELRQPMSSVIGYADLLLGESVGILGALQRKFIERIRTSTERIGSLVDDLIQMNALESGALMVKPESIDLNLIIDNAMTVTSGQMREKNIALRIDIPENLMPLYADREAMQQILVHLLQNAGAASPVEGSVTLRVRIQSEGGSDYVIIQVSDTGGGIPKADLSRVFSRLYRAENALIEGVGDTGVGLSIAKTLTDAQDGRIWVDTEMGVGSTFSVSLPLKSVIAVELPQGG